MPGVTQQGVVKVGLNADLKPVLSTPIPVLPKGCAVAEQLHGVWVRVRGKADSTAYGLVLIFCILAAVCGGQVTAGLPVCRLFPQCSCHSLGVFLSVQWVHLVPLLHNLLWCPCPPPASPAYPAYPFWNAAFSLQPSAQPLLFFLLSPSFVTSNLLFLKPFNSLALPSFQVY